MCANWGSPMSLLRYSSFAQCFNLEANACLKCGVMSKLCRYIVNSLPFSQFQAFETVGMLYT